MFDDFFALSALSRGTISTSFVGPREVTRGAEGGDRLCSSVAYIPSFVALYSSFEIPSEGTEELESKINFAVVYRKVP